VSRSWFTKSRRVLIHAAAFGPLALVGCGSDGPTAPLSLPVTVSGTLVNRSGTAIPTNSRVVAVWAGSDGDEEYAYVFGEGVVDLATNRFTITFDRNPPSEALLVNQLGVAFVVLTTNPDLHEGRLPSSGGGPPPGVIGATGQHAVIYLNADPEIAQDWVRDFRRGYNVGRGIDLPGTFDGFAPADLGSMELIVDDLANIEFVNWT
jgi:hypothetical protein